MDNTCDNCKAQLLPEARFCHVCGTKVVQKPVACPSCQMENPAEAKFCHSCGHPLQVSAQQEQYQPRHPIDWDDIPTLPTQFRELFIQFIREHLRQEGDPSQEGASIEAFYHSGFQSYFEGQAIRLTQRLERLWEESRSVKLVERQLEQQFYRLLDRFFIRYARNLLPHPLPTAILNYENSRWESVHLQQMLLDFLCFEEEQERYYRNAIEIPYKKLQGARRSFLKEADGETPLVFCDQSLLRPGREGFAFTHKGMYWKAHFHRPARVLYKDIRALERQEDRLSINGQYFNVSPSLNYKVFKLLLKIRRLREKA